MRDREFHLFGSKWRERMTTKDNIRHVYPIGDTMEHDTETPECACCPRIVDTQDGRYIVHHAMDGRE